MIPAGLDPFVALTAPRRQALLQFATETRTLRESLSWLPMADSPAMAELTAESALAGPSPWGDLPVTDSHNGTVLLLVAAEDHLLALCRMLERPEPTAFAPVVLARAALEAAGRAAWLAEPGIGAKRRVARYMTERLYSAAELLRLPGIPPQAAAEMESRRAGILAEADRLGFQKIVKKNTPTTLEEARLGLGAAIKRLFADDQLGGLLYGFYSAIAHSTFYGLTQAMATESAVEEPLGGALVKVALGSSADHVNTMLAAVTVGYIEAVTTVYRLHGWRSDEWEATCLGLARTARSQASA